MRTPEISRADLVFMHKITGQIAGICMERPGFCIVR